MTELPPDARALLAQARAEQSRTNPARRARVRVAVERAVALSVAASAEHNQPELAATKVAAKHSLGKLAAATLASTLAVVSVVWLSQGVDRKLAPRASATVTQATVAVPSPSSEPAQPLVPQTPVPESAPEKPSPAGRAGSVRAPAQREALAGELRVVRRADQALRAGDAHAALTMLTAYRDRFQDGQLTLEREGLMVVAECMLDSRAAFAHAQAYLHGRPASLVRSRVVAACALGGEP